MSPGRAVSILCWHRRGRPRANVWLATPLSHVFNIGDFFNRRASAVNSRQKNPGRSRGQTASDRLAVLLLSALALSALTALLSALSGLLLLLAWLLLAAAALLLARLVLAALLLAGVLLVRIVHNFSYFGSSP
jgi:hypothetical protein